MARTKLQTSSQLLEKRPTLFNAYDKPLNASAYTQEIHDAVDVGYSQNYRRPIHYYNFAKDWEDLVSQYGRNKLSSMARVLYSNTGVIQSTVNSIAMNVIGWGWDWIPKMQDLEWGTNTKAYLQKISPRVDVRGNAKSFQYLLYQTQIAKTLDGDCLWIFTTSEDGQTPQFQVMPSQRIGNRNGQETVGKSQYRNFQIRHGCVLNPVGRTVAYQVLGDSEDGKEDIIVPMDACYLVYNPTMFDQYRGVSGLASIIGDLKDYSDIRNNWKQVVHQDSVLNTVIRQKDSVATMAEKLGDLPVGTIGSGNKEPIYGRYVNGPEIRVFAPETGEDIELKDPQRPSQNIMEFMEHIMHSILSGMGWIYEMEKIKDLSPANARFVLAKAQNIIAYYHQETILGVWQWATKKMVAHLMTTKQIPFNAEWFKWEPTPTRRLSIDFFKDTQSDLKAIQGGISNYDLVLGQDGLIFEDVAERLAQNLAYFQALATKYNIPLELLVQRSPNVQSYQQLTQPQEAA